MVIILAPTIAFLFKENLTGFHPSFENIQSTGNIKKDTSADAPTSIDSKNQLMGQNNEGDFAQTIANSGSSSETVPLNLDNTAQNMSSPVWTTVADNAWQYFQPGVGISEIGIPKASLDNPYVTDWDIGVYIQAIIDVQRIGILPQNGTWGAEDRIDKILTFIETRELNPENLPYWWYTSDTGAAEGGKFDITDSGRLLFALSNLKTYDPSLTDRIDSMVKVRMDYSSELNTVAEMSANNDVYSYIIASGFAAFWPNLSYVPNAILNNLISSPQVETYGVQLPIALILCDPVLTVVLDLEQPDQRMVDLSQQVYLAHEARYNATNQFVAFGEGMSSYGNFIYGWVAADDGRTWVVHDTSGNDFPLVTSVVFSKVAFGFLSLYDTSFTQSMVAYIESKSPEPVYGYCDGIDNSDPISSRLISEFTTNTNGLIISAARYASQSPYNQI